MNWIIFSDELGNNLGLIISTLIFGFGVAFILLMVS